MAKTDKRFALIREGKPWYAAIITKRGSALGTYRISTRGKTRDAYMQAEYLEDIEIVVRRVLKERKRMRCAQENGQTSSLDLESKGVEGYWLDPILALKFGMPPKGTV